MTEFKRIDDFLQKVPQQLNHNEHVLVLHERFKGPLAYTEVRNRYRGYLVWFEYRMDEDYMFVTSIDGMINQLNINRRTSILSSNDIDFLNYLNKNRFIVN